MPWVADQIVRGHPPLTWWSAAAARRWRSYFTSGSSALYLFVYSAPPPPLPLMAPSVHARVHILLNHVTFVTAMTLG